MYAIAPNLDKIGSEAFKEFTNLLYVYAPKCRYIQERAFENCYSLFECIFNPINVGELAFNNCISLQRVNLKSIKQFERLCFNNCVSLSVIENDYVEDFNVESSFMSCSNLQLIRLRNARKISNLEQLLSKSLLLDLPTCTSLTLDNNHNFQLTSKTSDYVKNLCSSLGPTHQVEELDFPLEFDKLAFKNHKQFIQTRLPLNNASSLRGFVSNLQKIPPKTFQAAKTLLFVQLPHCQVVHEEAFYSCHALRIVGSPELREIGPRAFYGCVSLTSIDVKKVVEIGNGSFFYCQSLVSCDFASLKQAELPMAFASNGALVSVLMGGKPAVFWRERMKQPTGEEQVARLVKHQEVLVDRFQERAALMGLLWGIKQRVKIVRRSQGVVGSE